ncbi:hypothetical protein BpHYR1_045343 [Brachionus plicatilis]|uniref:Uncharacterized protein n=1 Tax=Brachionus plicatilis TaxID=10195 RepID=A0A3M7SS63_BRAPC|nr:hypothetical protein BpHYR1_045343 [Brachionus plicatilis]
MFSIEHNNPIGRHAKNKIKSSFKKNVGDLELEHIKKTLKPAEKLKNSLLFNFIHFFVEILALSQFVSVILSIWL